jgi:S-formylglutathione hydrolase FrmB
MVLAEAISKHGRVAIGGISMGGYGALLLGSRDRRFCAVGVQSPALWLSPGETAPGAFDSAQDYERNDVFRLRPPRPLWIDLGASDPFRNATLAYARRADVHAHLWTGGHDVGFWDAHTPALLRFFARACA